MIGQRVIASPQPARSLLGDYNETHVFLALTTLIVASGGNTAFAQYDCPGGQRPVPPAVAEQMALPCAASTLPSVGLEICASCATRGTCIRTLLVPIPCRKNAITGFGDHPVIFWRISSGMRHLSANPCHLPALRIRFPRGPVSEKDAPAAICHGVGINRSLVRSS